jgi:hypothetical protein
LHPVIFIAAATLGAIMALKVLYTFKNLDVTRNIRKLNHHNYGYSPRERVYRGSFNSHESYELRDFEYEGRVGFGKEDFESVFDWNGSDDTSVAIPSFDNTLSLENVLYANAFSVYMIADKILGLEPNQPVTPSRS